MKRLLPIALAAVMGAAQAQSVALFEAAQGLPNAQGWFNLSIGNPGSESLANNIYTLDSTGAGVDTWGKARFSPLPLDGQLGYSVSFGLRVANESHSHPDRGGFSMLFVGSDATRSIEIAFTADDVFAYEISGGAFVHGTGAALQTGAVLRAFTLQVANGQYTLSTEGNVLFGGSLQDYTAVGPAVYSLENFVFFGDNTSSGSSQIEMTHILLNAVPEPGTALLWAGGLAGLALRLRRRSRLAAAPAPQSRGIGRG